MGGPAGCRCVLKKLGKKSWDDVDPDDPRLDVQLTKAEDVLRVKMGILPKSVLEKLQQAGKTEEAECEAKKS